MKASVVALVSVLLTVSAVPRIPKLTLRPERDDACQAVNVNIAYTDQTKALLISWTPPASCPDASSYVVDLSINGVQEIIPQLAAGIPMAQKVLDSKPLCDKISAVVETFDAAGGSLGLSTESNLPLSLPDIEKPTLKQNDDGVQITWTPLELEGCVVTYSVTVADGTPESIDSPQYLVPNSQLLVCEEITVHIQAFSNDFHSKVVEEMVSAKMPAVDDIEVSITENSIGVDFSPLSADKIAAACGSVNYRVVEREEACFRSTYAVSAVSENDIEGLEATKLVSRRPTSVNNLKADVKGNDIILEWAAPTGGEQCNLEYSGKYGETPLGIVHSTSMTIPYTTTACSLDKLEVWALSGTLVGEVSSVDMVGELGAVVNLQCIAGASVDGKRTVGCSWDEPTDCTDSLADMKYEVKYFDGVEVKTVAVPYHVLEFETSSCLDSWIIVTPLLSDTVSGDTREVKVDGCGDRR